MLLSNGKFAPQALAELRPQLTDGWYYPTSNGLELERQFAYYDAIYRFQPWVRTVVDKIANAVARLTINVWTVLDEDGKRTRELDVNGPYARVIQSPSDVLSPYEFWLWVASTLEIYGEAYLLKVRDDKGRCIALEPIHPSRLSIKRDKVTGKYTYIWTGNNTSGMTGLLTFDEADIVPFRLFNPAGVERGLSRLESLRSTLFSEDSSRNATSAMWRNAGMPNFMITAERQLSPDAQERLRKQFDSIHAGSRNAGKTVVLEAGMDVKQLQLTAVEMQFIQSRQLNREEICGVYDIAEPMVQILDRATFSNITAQMRAFYRDTMAPRLELIESALNTHLGSEFNLNKVASFAVADVLRGDYETRANAVAQLVQMGVMKPAEGRELMELNDAGDIADRLYANAAIQPLGSPAERITLTGQVTADGDPDGVPLIQVPSPTGDSSIAVPSPNAPDPTIVPTPDPKSTGIVPTQQRYVRALRGGVGRGEQIRDLALKLARRNPEDLEDILAAVRIAIDERDSQ